MIYLKDHYIHQSNLSFLYFTQSSKDFAIAIIKKKGEKAFFFSIYLMYLSLLCFKRGGESLLMRSLHSDINIQRLFFLATEQRFITSRYLINYYNEECNFEKIIDKL